MTPIRRILVFEARLSFTDQVSVAETQGCVLTPLSLIVEAIAQQTLVHTRQAITILLQCWPCNVGLHSDMSGRVRLLTRFHVGWVSQESVLRGLPS